jgi:hypothetical protein
MHADDHVIVQLVALIVAEVRRLAEIVNLSLLRVNYPHSSR